MALGCEWCCNSYGIIGYTICMIKYKDLKKDDDIQSNQIVGPVNKDVMPTGKLLESPRQGKGLKKTILIRTNGSEVGLFDEAGSVYAPQIRKVWRDGNWQDVIDHPAVQMMYD